MSSRICSPQQKETPLALSRPSAFPLPHPLAPPDLLSFTLGKGETRYRLKEGGRQRTRGRIHQVTTVVTWPFSLPPTQPEEVLCAQLRLPGPGGRPGGQPESDQGGPQLQRAGPAGRQAALRGAPASRLQAAGDPVSLRPSGCKAAAVDKPLPSVPRGGRITPF